MYNLYENSFFFFFDKYPPKKSKISFIEQEGRGGGVQIENSNPAFSVCVKVPQEQEYVFKICICNLKIAQKDLDEKK